MILFRIALTLIMPLGTWLVFGAPGLSYSGNLLVFAFMTIFEVGWLWLRPLTRMLRGDEFTYGTVSAVFAAFGVLGTIAIGAICFYQHDFMIRSVKDIRPLAFFGWLVAFVIVLIVPVASSGHASKLPHPSDRRKYQDPV